MTSQFGEAREPNARQRPGETSRRNFLGLVGLGAAVAASGGLLSACSKTPTSQGGSQVLDKYAALLPTRKDLTLPLPPADIKGVPPVADAYTKFPGSLTKAITEKPGTSGQEVKAMTPQWGPPPPGIPQNAYLAAVNAELGTPINFTIADGNTYADKLNAMLGARDVPDLLCIPSWEYPKIPRFSEAVKTLFEDLTPYLKGSAVDAYPMLASYPTAAWRESIWNEALYAVPNDTTLAIGWMLFARKDLLDKAGQAMPTNLEQLLSVAKAMTKPDAKVWAFNDVFPMIQMFHKTPGAKGGWRLKADKTPEFKYETAEYRAALEVMAQIYKDGLVHPDVVASKGADSTALFAPGGQIIFNQAGPGMMPGAQSQHQKVVPDMHISPVVNFAVGGGAPLIHGDEVPVSFTFIKKGLGQDRVKELLRLINWCSAPFGTQEYNLRENGVEGQHHTMGPGGPVKTDLGFKEIANQYFFISGRRPVQQPVPDVSWYHEEYMQYLNAMAPNVEKDPWDGIKLEMPAAYKANQVPFEDKFTDVVRGRRPLSDVDAIVKEWKAQGGDEGRALLAKALQDAGRA
jgi:putative aldouronate transport system substrate-binding protein